MKVFFLGFCICILTFSCSSVKRTKTLKEVKLLEERFQDHVGFMLYDPEKGKILGEYNSHKYFTPASNTKILTLYASLNIIPDSIPAFYYVQRSDSLIMWGTGDPSFLFPQLPQHQGLKFLKESDYKLYYSDANFTDKHFGPGWAWDDYAYSFSVERSGWPIYGNRLTISKNRENTFLEIDQPYFKSYFSLNDSVPSASVIYRDRAKNQFFYAPNILSDAFSEEVPFAATPEVFVNLLADTLSRKVRLIDEPLPTHFKTFNGIASDSAYKVMMQDSDNYVAEQLMLVCSGLTGKELNIDKAINYVTDELLSDMPDKPVWVDGSGLSRYNLITPRSVVWLWDQLRNQVPESRLKSLLATGGKSGTLKNYYKGDKPYVFGKTGTLSNNHSLSGFLITKSGKLLIFSFMNNSYPDKSAPVKRAMEKLIRDIHLNY